jgi:sugar lactone lactonase YvrE
MSEPAMSRSDARGSDNETADVSRVYGAVNFAFGGPDLRTLLCCAHTSVYTLRVKVPGNPHPWYRLHKG